MVEWGPWTPFLGTKLGFGFRARTYKLIKQQFRMENYFEL